MLIYKLRGQYLPSENLHRFFFHLEMPAVLSSGCSVFVSVCQVLAMLQLGNLPLHLWRSSLEHGAWRTVRTAIQTCSSLSFKCLEKFLFHFFNSVFSISKVMFANPSNFQWQKYRKPIYICKLWQVLKFLWVMEVEQLHHWEIFHVIHIVQDVLFWTTHLKIKWFEIERTCIGVVLIRVSMPALMWPRASCFHSSCLGRRGRNLYGSLPASAALWFSVFWQDLHPVYAWPVDQIKWIL